MTQTPTVPTATSETLDYSDKLFNEIKEVEGNRKNEKGLHIPYLDSAGLPTIGFGTRFYDDGREVTLEDTPITDGQADSLLNSYIGTVEEKLRTNFPKMQNMNSNQVDAVMSFTYNVGANWMDLGSGFETITKGLESGDTKVISDAFKLYNKHENPDNPAGPLIESDGLNTRRKNEKDLFNTPYVINKPKTKYQEYMTDE